MPKRWLLMGLFAAALPTLPLQAQFPQFHGGLATGVNFAELEGDGVTDYAGLNAGLWSSIRFHRHWQAGLGMHYSRNGEYILPDYYPDLDYGQIRLDHIEVPVHIAVLTFCSDDGTASKGGPSKRRPQPCMLSFQWGLAYAYLLRHQVKDAQGFNRSDQVHYGNRDALLMQSGFTVQAHPRLGLRLKASLVPWTPELGATISALLIVDLSPA